jgi:hypothetical protein
VDAHVGAEPRRHERRDDQARAVGHSVAAAAQCRPRDDSSSRRRNLQAGDDYQAQPFTVREWLEVLSAGTPDDVEFQSRRCGARRGAALAVRDVSRVRRRAPRDGLQFASRHVTLEIRSRILGIGRKVQVSRDTLTPSTARAAASSRSAPMKAGSSAAKWSCRGARRSSGNVSSWSKSCAASTSNAQQLQ